MKLKYKLALLSVTFGAAGCNSNNCGDCGKQEREPKRIDTVYVIVKEKKPCPDMEFDVYDKDHRSSGVIWWGEAKKTGKTGGKKVEEKKPEEKKPEEKKPEEKKPEEPKTYTGISVIDVYHQNCNSY